MIVYACSSYNSSIVEVADMTLLGLPVRRTMTFIPPTVIMIVMGEGFIV